MIRFSKKMQRVERKMLSCVYNEKPFTTKQEGFTTDDKYMLSRERHLLCPVCKASVYFCEDGEKIAHFTHHKVADCPIGNYRSYDYSSTEKHDSLVDEFTDWIKEQHPEAYVYPDYIINNEFFTDVYFELGEVKVGIEIQFKNLSNTTFIKRRDLYRKYNIKDIWFFIRENEDYSIGAPYQRTYYRNNYREIYFYQIEEAICKAYKGFSGESWQFVGKNTLFNAVSVQVPLEQIKIIDNGRIIIPELRHKYLQKLKEKREKDKQKREKNRLFREHVKQEIIERQKYISRFIPKQDTIENKSINITQTENLQNKQFRNSMNNKQIVQNKAINQEYKEYTFKTENNNDYFCITIIYQGKEYKVKYLIINKTVSINETYLICKKESDEDNIRYSIDINKFLDSMKKVKIQRYEFNENK